MSERALHDVAREGAWYSAANLVSKVAGLCLLPVFANGRWLSAHEFGVWALIEGTAQAALPLAGLQLKTAVVRLYPGDDGDRVLPTAVYATLVLAGGFVVVAAAIVAIASPSALAPVLYAALAYLAAEMVLAIPLAALRAQGRAGAFGAAVALRALSSLALVWALVAGLGLALFGVALGFACSSAAALLIAVVLVGPAALLGPFSRRQLLALVRFAWPLAVDAAASALRRTLDRYAIALLLSPAAVAVYVVAARVAGLVEVLGVSPLRRALWPSLFREPQTSRALLLSAVLEVSALGFAAAILLLSAAAPLVLLVTGAEPRYQMALLVVPWLALAASTFGIAAVFSSVLALGHRTSAMARQGLIVAAGSAALHLALVPWLGLFGAALAMLLSSVLLLALAVSAARPILPVPARWTVVVTLLAGSTALASGLRLASSEGVPEAACASAGVLVALGLLAAAAKRVRSAAAPHAAADRQEARA